MNERNFEAEDPETGETDPAGKRWVTLREAARALGVSVSTIRRQVQAGELPARLSHGKHGERYLIDLSPDDSRKSEPVQAGGEPTPEQAQSDTSDRSMAPEPVQFPTELVEVVPLAAHLELVRLLDEEKSERRQAQLDAVRLERRLATMEMELQFHQRALSESAESLRQREQAREDEIALTRAELAKWQEAEARRRARPWWRRMLG